MAAFAPALGQSLRSRPPRNSSGQQGSPRQLEFGSAMKDFKSMFPEMDDEVIEAVLRANNGLVDATIDQLLTMGAVSGENSTNSSDLPFLPSYNDTETQEPPPAYTPREGALIDVEDSEPRPLPARPYSAWNPPLLGTLPDDFLRLGPSSMQARVHPNPPSQTTPKQQTTAEHDLEQFLEDEKLAMILQNEEFMRELRHNSDFMMSLEKARYLFTSVSTGTRKKFDKIARVFQRKKNTQQVNLINGSSQSTANLLEDYEDDDDGN
ncbi:predicted protein [Nematostella vectensis]|uniref:CUE domain-containing protein n=1 Tax=Nematostella vectensis TaxID=45351 RepID=A7S4P0_NEMVE|nr:predicted protein [Nematostella vectensis]|eukprot:XP_001633381.1 predicted protein [Nematostella vectensis]